MPSNPHSGDSNPNQGTFLGVEYTLTGTTDPTDQRVTPHIVELDSADYFQTETELSQSGAYEFPSTEAATTRKRHVEQLGKHSLLGETGTYSPQRLRPGHFLPGFGPVTHTNYKKAVGFALELEAQRQQSRSGFNAPTLADAPYKTTEPASDAFIHSAESATGYPSQLTGSERVQVVAERVEDTDFLPVTKGETTDVLPLVDEVGRGNVQNHLNETHRKNYKEFISRGFPHVAAEWHGKRAVISRIYEMDDYFENASTSLTALLSLKTELDEILNPELKLDRVLDGKHIGFAPLVRHMVVSQLMHGGLEYVDMDFQPMTAKELRLYPKVEPVLDAATKRNAQARTAEYSDELLWRRNKVVQDPFTTPDPSPEVAAYIERIVQGLSVGSAQAALAKAIVSEQNRMEYWRRILGDVQGIYRAGTQRILESQIKPATA